MYKKLLFSLWHKLMFIVVKRVSLLRYYK
jgi:hypothetical protein